MIMAHQQVAIIITEVHPIPLAIAEHLALFTITLLCPFTLAINLETIVPNLPETVFVDIPLIIIGANAWTT